MYIPSAGVILTKNKRKSNSNRIIFLRPSILQQKLKISLLHIFKNYFIYNMFPIIARWKSLLFLNRNHFLQLLSFVSFSQNTGAWQLT